VKRLFGIVTHCAGAVSAPSGSNESSSEAVPQQHGRGACHLVRSSARGPTVNVKLVIQAVRLTLAVCATSTVIGACRSAADMQQPANGNVSDEFKMHRQL
jgi:hypothetical protein